MFLHLLLLHKRYLLVSQHSGALCNSSSYKTNEGASNDKRDWVRRSVPDPALLRCLYPPSSYPINEILERENENEGCEGSPAPGLHPGRRASVLEPRTRNEVSVNEDPRKRTPVCTVCTLSPRGSDCRSKLPHHN